MREIDGAVAVREIDGAVGVREIDFKRGDVQSFSPVLDTIREYIKTSVLRANSFL